VDLGTRVPELLEPHPAVRSVRLTGSRASGTAITLSDWDFAVEANDLDALMAAFPELVAPLEPLAEQWDPLGEPPAYMLILRGPVKLDLIFFHDTVPQQPPWEASADTLPRIDAHFWDWILWLAAKRARGKDELVRDELAKMHGYLLRPLGVVTGPATIDDAIDKYLVALEGAERRFGVTVPPTLREEVLPALRGTG
jgi:hypothetical protein